ncbi:hypothetical protein J2Z62_000534 [Mycoplasmoides fastidiosum]|uniref:Uncharacterized protein n=1 Tax=Mycoplasmoides fastidiosum TaxID=92758 RepID=A0ABU0LZH0_9BACT|nr:hypothetical protein [Mycoplasmoides fastidiosum]MDQ0514096.1 hypothetical protein [Mycoplasmoides fastidiosum]UUD37495.1 hypothetical protein NPA10_02910 [Mycoplasmoides fastidiosum]
MKKIAKRLFSSALFWFVGTSTLAGITNQNHGVSARSTSLFNPVNQQLQRHEANTENIAQGLSVEKVGIEIKESLQKIHEHFKYKFQQIRYRYPTSSSDRVNQAITYLLYKITDPIQAGSVNYYDQLVRNLTTIIDQNFSASIFKTRQNEPTDTYLPHPNYQITGNWKNNQNFIINDNIINTISPQEIENKVKKFLSNFVNFLIGENDKKFKVLPFLNEFGMDWYDQIPNSLKPKIIYDKSFTESDYLNLIDALTTTKQNSSIITNATELNKKTEEFNEKLNQRQIEDLKYLKSINSSDAATFSRLFTDSSIEKFNNLVDQIDSKYRITSPTYFWNLNFSQIDLIAFNKVLYPNIKVLSKKINYSTSTNQSPSFSYVLQYNNAFLGSNVTNLPYTGNFETNVQSILENTTKLISENFLKFFKIKDTINLRNSNLYFEVEDFEKTEITQELEKILPFEIKITNLFREFHYGAYTMLNEPLADELHFTTDFEIKFGNKDSFNWYKTFYKEGKTILIFPSYEIIDLLNVAPNFVPIWSYNDLNDLTADSLKSSEALSKVFDYGNTDIRFKYEPVELKLWGKKVILTTKLSLLGTDATRTYESELPIADFFNFKHLDDDFELLKNQIEEQIKVMYPEQYEYYMREENKWLRDQIINEALSIIENNPEFLSNSWEENVELFKEKFLKYFEDFFTQNPNGGQRGEIYQHYQGLREKLISVLNRLGISLDSDLAKSLLNQINYEEQKSLEVNEIVPPSPELVAIINFLDDPHNNVDKLKEFAPLLEKINPYLFAKTFDTTKRVSLYAVSGLTFMMSLISSGFIWRVSRLDGQKFRLRKGIFLTVGITILLLSLGGSGFLISLMAAG